MVNILDATLVKDRMLDLLCTRVGFFPRIEIDAQVLKYIVASFPYIVKNKGSETGIKAAVNAILKAENNPKVVAEPRIEIVKDSIGGHLSEPYTIYIYTLVSIYNKAALDELLRYVVPAGFTYKLLEYDPRITAQDAGLNKLSQADGMRIIQTNVEYSSSLRTSLSSISDNVGKETSTWKKIFNNVTYDSDNDDKNNTNMAERVINAYDTSQIISSNDLLQRQEQEEQ